MHDDRELVERRIARELTERVLPLVHTERQALAVSAGPSPDQLAPFRIGDQWGAPWATTWFGFDGEIPAHWAGARVEAVIDLGFHPDAAGFQCEGLVVDRDGQPVQGIHPRRTNLAVEPSPGPVSILLEAASNPAFVQFRPSPLGRAHVAANPVEHERLYRFRRADLVVVDSDAEALAHDLHVLDGLMRTLDVRDPRRTQLRARIADALDLVPDVLAARRALAPAFAEPARTSAHRIVATGHAHIDTAWLWPIRETVRKCTRTFASAVGLLDRYPDHVFVCSQAQQYQWIEERHPALFDEITRHVADGRWIPLGGMWVESDMNLPSGESLARQIVHGQRYFEDRFGVRCTEMWIPDVFGYPASLPQLFAAGGMRRFVTQKLSWNKQNRFPHHTFWWEGLDGTRVLTHFPPVDTYNAEVTPEECAHASANFADHHWSRWSLMPFGHGDGGGGPTREMVERARRLRDVDGSPRVEIGSPAEFFRRVEREIHHGAPVPVWRGELYFETHRGTLTSQSRTKAGNLRCERLFRAVELWAATAQEPAGVDHLWRDVLTQQFHDILPGSSIAWVHHDAEETFARVGAELGRRLDDLTSRLASDDPCVVNVAPIARDEIAMLPIDPLGDGPRQPLADGGTAFRVRVRGSAITPAVAAAVDDRVVVTDRSMTSGHLAVRWDDAGNLTSLIDVRHAREIFPEGALGALLELSVDQPVEYDAWDVEAWTVAAGAPITSADHVEVIADGPLVGMVKVERSFGPSTATIVYTLRAGSPRLDIDLDVDWQHREHLLSLAFPLDVRADAATCDIQFGTVQRPTHPSTPWDAAKFEVCAHRFVDISEPSFGVAVLNDGPYGHGLFDGRVRVSLLRGARYPDPDADLGTHRFRLALLPHGPGLTGVTDEAARFTLPLVAAHGSAGTTPAPIVELHADGVEIDAIKLADDGSGDLVVRLHEHLGDRRAVTLSCDRPVTAASRCNLLEEAERGLEVGDGIVSLVLRPFEIVTLRLVRRS